MPRKSRWSRNYSYHCKDADESEAFEDVITTLLNTTADNRNGAIAIMFRAGAKAISENPLYAHTALTQKVEMMEAMNLACRKAATKKKFRDVYREIGPEGFGDVTVATGVKFDDFLSEFKLAIPVEVQSDNRRKWIEKRLSDHQEHTVDAIIKDAVADGILPNPDENKHLFDREYNKFKYLANSMGVSGAAPRGKWKLSS